jgi:hypothetical protein
MWASSGWQPELHIATATVNRISGRALMTRQYKQTKKEEAWQKT